jgi:hypothetical protein
MKSARPGPKSPNARDPIVEQPEIVAAIAINAFARGMGRVAKERVMPHAAFTRGGLGGA